MPRAGTTHQVSAFLAITDLSSSTVLTHVVTGERAAVEPELGRALRSLTGPAGFTEEELRDLTGSTDGVLLEFLTRRGFVVGAGADERAGIDSLFALAAPVSTPRDQSAGVMRGFGRQHYFQPRPLSTGLLDGRSGPLRKLTVLALGGCVTEFARDELVSQGLERGLDVRLVGAWPDSRGRLRTLVDKYRPDVTVLQLSIQPYLTELWDHGPLATEDERRERAERLRKVGRSWIDALAAATRDSGIGIVHNYGPGALSPYGRYGHRTGWGDRETVARLNADIDEALRPHDHLMLLDEERLVARYGARQLFDDLWFPFGHHGGTPDPERETPHQLPLLGASLAREYLDLHTAHTEQGRVKCVVVDLDNTLWPGVAAEDGFSWLDHDRTSTWIHLGLHQALALLKSRGFLLVTASKGTESQTMERWRNVRHPLLLTPDDFVLHAINWEPKSRNLARVADSLGLAHDAILFLDDNPVERHEVRRALPGVRIAEGPVHGFRERLLTDPLLDRPPAGHEAARRTESTRGMLKRRELGETLDERALAREVGARVSVRRAGPDDVARLEELLLRTTQYRTTQWRPAQHEIAELVRDGRVTVCHVTDRFADYGLVGGCVVVDGRVICLVLSCRVIGLGVGPRLLAASVRELGPARERVRGSFEPSDRNTPAADVFERAGFRPDPDGPSDGGTEGAEHYVLHDPADLIGPEFTEEAHGPVGVS
ncbi:HAD-IIIC family phosphatase [Streptomyces sp. SID8352]|uniref:HAD-IIIC family phosphatase n=1 Tax=Streptomyces sp. SID8352 TaxID=2690338 RepID=UPI00137103E2|nr:HAD-IIIC family phosphatase [Streptomyces sp. SID8352]MYU21073.1 HAD-IIIC family phosphatase [Streptomyces sp. SID8352]